MADVRSQTSEERQPPAANRQLPLLSPAKMAWRSFRRHKLALASIVVLVLMVLAAILAPVLTPYGMDEQDLFNQSAPPSAEHPLGTDELGRDVLSRLLYGGRVSLSVGLFSALLSTIIGVLVGAAAGYFGGVVDNLLMRFVDLMLAFPSTFLLLILFAAIRPNVTTVILFLGVFGWLYLARIVRGEFLSLREKDFVVASRALGADAVRLIWRHLLPNVIGAIIVTTTLEIAFNLLAEGTLSFLGFGVPPEVPTWGNMLTSAASTYLSTPLLTIVPGVTLTLAVLAVNFIGDALRDALDPRG